MSDMQGRGQDRPAVRPAAAAALYLLAVAGLWGMSLLSGPIARLLVRIVPDATYHQLNLVVNVLYYGLFLLLPVALCARRTGGAAEALRLNPIPVGAAIRITFLAALCMMAALNFTVLWSALGQALGLNVFADDGFVPPQGTAELMRYAIAGVVVAPVCEELLFRGALLGAWEKRGTRRAVAVTAALFAMTHGSLMGLPAELLGGAMMAMLVVWTDSLYAGMIFHSAYNASTIILDLLAGGAVTEEAAAQAALMETDLVAALGGVPGLLMIAVDFALTLLIAFALAQPLHLRGAMRVAAREAHGSESAQIAPERARELKRGDFIPSTALRLSAGEIALLALAALCALGFYAVDLMNMLGATT